MLHCALGDREQHDASNILGDFVCSMFLFEKKEERKKKILLLLAHYLGAKSGELSFFQLSVSRH